MLRTLAIAALAAAASAAEISTVAMPLEQMPSPVRDAVARVGGKIMTATAAVVDRRILYTATLFGRGDDWYSNLELTYDQDGKLVDRRSIRQPNSPTLVSVEQHEHARVEHYSDGTTVRYYRSERDDVSAPSAPAASDPPTSAPPR